MNNIVANLLLNLTSPSRFEGSLNVDLNEITMNLVPFPKLHYLVSAISPLYTSQDLSLPPRRFRENSCLYAAIDLHGLLMQLTSLVIMQYISYW
jgi:hypothetical protein